MKPKATVHQAKRELFRTELEGLVDEGHALVKMGRQMNWASFDGQLGQTYDPSTGAPGVSTRLMVELHYLKDRYDLSGDVVLAQ